VSEPSQTRAPDFVEVVRRAITSRLAAVHTSIPAKVVDYDADEQRATVQIAVESCYIDPDSGELVFYAVPPLTRVPVAFPSSSGFSITWPLSKGDPVWLVFAERSTDEFRATGNDSNQPQDRRRFALEDAVAIPGGRPFADPIPAEGVADGALVVRGDDVRLGSSSASSVVALGPLVDGELNDLKAAFESWTPVPNDGGAALKTILTALFTTWPATVGATKVKAE
jgi:hypothetical protein